jgi:hypothetical protein
LTNSAGLHFVATFDGILNTELIKERLIKERVDIVRISEYYRLSEHADPIYLQQIAKMLEMFLSG